MTPPNKFTKAQEAKIRAVGRTIREARKAAGLTVNGAARRAVYDSKSGEMSSQTWTRAEQGYIATSDANGKRYHKTQCPSPRTLMSIADVLGLDGAALCKEVGHTPPRRMTPRPVVATTEQRQAEEMLKVLVERRAAELVDRLLQDRLNAIGAGVEDESQSARQAPSPSRGRRRASG